jgi:hypothetical protein
MRQDDHQRRHHHHYYRSGYADELARDMLAEAGIAMIHISGTEEPKALSRVRGRYGLTNPQVDGFMNGEGVRDEVSVQRD